MVWLDAPEAVLLERLQADPTPRPLLRQANPAARLAELLNQRRGLYAQADLHVLQNGGPPEEVARQVLEALPTILRQRQTEPAQAIQVVDPEGRTLPSIN